MSWVAWVGLGVWLLVCAWERREVERWRRRRKRSIDEVTAKHAAAQAARHRYSETIEKHFGKGR